MSKNKQIIKKLPFRLELGVPGSKEYHKNFRKIERENTRLLKSRVKNAEEKLILFVIQNGFVKKS